MLLGDEGLGRAKAQEKSPLVFQLLLLKTSPARLCGRPEPRHPAPPCPLSHEEPSPTAQQIWDVKRVGSPGVHTHVHTQTWTLGGGVQTPHYSMMSACLVLKGDGPIQWGLENPILWDPTLLLTAEGAAGLESP